MISGKRKMSFSGKNILHRSFFPKTGECLKPGNYETMKHETETMGSF